MSPAMAATAPEEDIDFETLQAQLDKTWAYAHSVVDSWTKPGKSAAAAAPSTMSDKELNDLLRRPSRLGVGAPMPDSSSSVASAREALKLKYKLEGKDKKKRAREEDEKSGTAGKGAEDEDEEESRASAIRKKPRLDPFASPGGKKRKAEKVMGAPHVKEQPVAGPSTLTAKDMSQSPRTDKKGKRRERSSSREQSEARHSPAVSATPSNAASSLKATSPEIISTSLPPSKAKSRVEKDVTRLPILNLDGPPRPPASPSKDLSAAERKREKRRRQKERRKAKRAQAKQGESGAVSDPDEDSGDE